MYDADGHRGDRNLVEDRKATGFFDTFIADGKRRSFAPLWWRTWRYAEIEVTTQAAPLTLTAFRVNETGYPFEQKAVFKSSDAGAQPHLGHRLAHRAGRRA